MRPDEHRLLQSVGKVRRWDRQKRQFIEIDCPTVVEQCNKSMGRADLSDMSISLYRTPIKAKRWCLKVLFHRVDIAKVNAWLIYRLHCNQLKVSKKSQLSLMKFTMMIAAALTKSRTIQRAIGRPSKIKSNGDLPLEKRKQPAPVPVAEVRYDNVAHRPEFREKQNKCRFCKTATGRVYCTKCDMCLCLSNSRNRFAAHHRK